MAKTGKERRLTKKGKIDKRHENLGNGDVLIAAGSHGRPKSQKKLRLTIRDAVERHGENAVVQSLLEDLYSPNPQLRIDARKHLLYYGYGKPVTQLEIGNKPGEVFKTEHSERLAELTEEELDRLLSEGAKDA